VANFANTQEAPMATMNISLPQAMKDFVEGQVATGRYANASDFIRDLIRDRQAAWEELAAEIQKGIDSGIAGEYDPGKIWDMAMDQLIQLGSEAALSRPQAAE
jgi:antitoxin ParD1/3/4